jgi:hypothetical protein
VGDGSPGSREAEGEGGEGFYIAQSGRCPDLLVIWGGGGQHGGEGCCRYRPPKKLATMLELSRGGGKLMKLP